MSLVLGLIFVFVRAPHPFGWLGIDHYHDLALTLARGGGFQTTDVPWGYAFFVAAFYRLFGDHPWIPLLAQVLLNATVPLMLFALVRRELGDRVAVWAAVLTGILSFSTVYASTLAADSLCTVVFLASLLLFARGVREGTPGWFAISGLLAGIAPQLRPNLLLFPPVLVAVALATGRRPRRAASSFGLYLGVALLAMLPWVVRNQRLTGDFLLTSSHGGQQLWYGTLQSGPYLESRAHNPRSVFESPAFDYTSLANRTIIVAADAPGCAPADSRVELSYWTDRDRTVRRIPGARGQSNGSARLEFVLPGQAIPTAVYYYFSVMSADGHQSNEATPPGGAGDPFVAFVDDHHLEDLDRHDDLLDVFDLVRALRSLAWGEGPDVSDDDVRGIVQALLLSPSADVVLGMRADKNTEELVLSDGSTFSVPRPWRGMITDVSAGDGLAAALCYARRTRTSLTAAVIPTDRLCFQVGEVRVNEVFYRNDPHLMRRYLALALDNIRRDPRGFAMASVYRIARLFVVVGTTDRHTAQQFAGSAAVYALATLASLTYALLGIAGIAIALYRRMRVALLVTPIVYVPATICFVLTNMRYTVTVQPFVLTFAALALVAIVDAFPWRRARAR